MPTSTFSTYDGSFTVEDAEATSEDVYLEDIGLWRNGLVEVRTPGIAGVVCGKTDHPAEVTLEALDTVGAAQQNFRHATRGEVLQHAVPPQLLTHRYPS